MRLLPKQGMLFPVSIIVSIHLLVLVCSLVVTGDLFDPITKFNPKVSKAPLSSDDLVSNDEVVSTSSSKALFRIHEALNVENDSEEPFQYFSTIKQDQDIEYKVVRGDTVSSLWVKNGAPSFGASRAITAVQGAGLSRFTLKSGELINLRLSRDGDISRLSKVLSDGATLVITGSSTDGYDASVVKPNIVEEQRSVAGTILSSFAASASDQGVPYELIDDVVDLFSNRIEFSRAIQPGDSFTITFTEKRCSDSGQVLDIGHIVNASFKRGEKLFAAIRHQTANGSFVYFDEKGQQGGDFFLRYPLKFTRISSTFSWARFHPILQKSRPHRGVDFAAPTGTPIRSVGDGVVEVLGFKSAPGNMIRIKHSDRWTTVYMHLQKFAPGLKNGQRISRGQLIGFVGSTGLSTGAHLHFELWEHGKYVDPMAADLPNISQDSKGLPAGFLTATLKELEQKHQKVQVAFAASGRNRG